MRNVLNTNVFVVHQNKKKLKFRNRNEKKISGPAYYQKIIVILLKFEDKKPYLLTKSSVDSNDKVIQIF